MQCQANTLLPSTRPALWWSGSVLTIGSRCAPTDPGWAAAGAWLREGRQEASPPSTLQQVAPGALETRGSEESGVELIKSTSAVLRGASVNSEAKPRACSIQGGG